MSRKRQDLGKKEYVVKALTDGKLQCGQIVTCILKNGTASPLYPRDCPLASGIGNPTLRFDTTVLYSGGRRTTADSLKTAAEHGFTEVYLGCPVRIGDGMDGRDVVEPRAIVIFPRFRGRDYQESGWIRHLFPLQGTYRVLFRRCHQEHRDGTGLARPKTTDACRCPSPSESKKTLPVRTMRQGLPHRCGRPPGGGEPIYDLKICIGCSQCIALCPRAGLKDDLGHGCKALSGEARGDSCSPMETDRLEDSHDQCSSPRDRGVRLLVGKPSGHCDGLRVHRWQPSSPGR